MLDQDLDDRIINQHKKLYPDVTASEQLDKFNEELVELYLEKPYTEAHKFEVADVIISGRAYELMTDSNVLEETYILVNAMRYYSEETVIKYVIKKLDINLERKWKKVKGAYRHN